MDTARQACVHCQASSAAGYAEHERAKCWACSVLAVTQAQVCELPGTSSAEAATYAKAWACSRMWPPCCTVHRTLQACGGQHTISLALVKSSPGW